MKLELDIDDVNRLEIALALAVGELDEWYGGGMYARTLQKVRMQIAIEKLDDLLSVHPGETKSPLMIALELVASLEPATTGGGGAIANCPP